MTDASFQRIPTTSGPSSRTETLAAPDDTIAVDASPTRTGKKLKVPVKRLIQGRPLAQIIGTDTVDDPDALAAFARFAHRT